MLKVNQDLIRRARSYAQHLHTDTNQKYGEYLPYFFHVDLVGRIAWKYASYLPDEDRSEVIAAAYLHDVIEDCRVTYNDLEKNFGQKVADLVYAVTNEKGKNREQRANDKYYQGIRDTPHATYIKLCDRMANAFFSSVMGTNQVHMYKKEHEKFYQHLWSENYNVMFADLNGIFLKGTFSFKPVHENVCGIQKNSRGVQGSKIHEVLTAAQGMTYSEWPIFVPNLLNTVGFCLTKNLPLWVDSLPFLCHNGIGGEGLSAQGKICF